MIRFHAIPNVPLETSDLGKMEVFRDTLNAAGITCTIRASRGEDIFAACGHEIQTPFRRMSYKDAMELYGSDKPDLRFDLAMVNVIDIFAKSNNEIFKKNLNFFYLDFHKIYLYCICRTR